MKGKLLLKAILEADVVGYSKLVAEDEVKTAAAVAQRFEEFDKIAKSHGAQQTAHEGGDSFLAIFPSAQSAAVASVESQVKFWRMNQAAQDQAPIHFRIGIDQGDVYIEDNRPTGNAVNTAARLEALADPGGICVSGAVYAQIHNKVDFTFEVLGERLLKNIPAPVHAFKASVYPISEVAQDAVDGTDFGMEPYIPKIGRKPTDLDWNRFMRNTFSVIRNRFQQNLGSLKALGDGVEIDFQSVHDRMFISKVYVGGVQKAQSRIWSGSFGGTREQIYYSTQDVGADVNTGWNECVSPAIDSDSLALSAMGHHFGPISQEFDLDNLSPEEAAEYLWRMFVQYLE